MVYPGRPSHGCLACIARKVKCDEGKPECERCKKREQPCPGYRNPRDHRFKKMTGRGKSAADPSTSSRPSSEISETRLDETGSFVSSSQINLLTLPPHQNFCDQAVAFFFNQYVIDANDGGNPGFLDFLPELYARSKPDDALAHSVKAISYITLSGKSVIKVLFARGHEHYRTTLNRITRMLESPEDTVQDSLIVAIMLVVLFENVTREKPAVMMSHAKGLHTLLLHRGEKQFSSAQGWTIFRHVNAQTQIRNIELCEYPSPEIVQWLRNLDTSSPASGAISEKYRIAQVRAKAIRLLAQSPNSPELESQLLAMLDETQQADAEIAQWADELPSPCQYQTWKLDSNGLAEKAAAFPTANESTGSPSGSLENTQYLMTYNDVWFASLWHGHRTSRLMLNETIITLSRRLNVLPPTQAAITTIQEMCVETCASISFSLGDIQIRTDENEFEYLEMNIDSRTRQGAGAGAYFVVWSLRHVVSCEFASEAQVTMASEALVRIGAQYGIKQAFTLANRLYQCHPQRKSS